MKKIIPFGNKITQLPVVKLVSEGQAQRDRVIDEVMEALFNLLPNNAEGQPAFTLADGTQCWLKKFYAPRLNEEAELVYGFDVKFEDGKPLSHLEFTVKCTGWERVLAAPIS